MTKVLALLKAEINRMESNVASAIRGYTNDPDLEQTIEEFKEAYATLTNAKNTGDVS